MKKLLWLILLLPLLAMGASEHLTSAGRFFVDVGIGTQAPDGALDVSGDDVFLHASATAPIDSRLANSQCTWSIDEPNDEVDFKCKESGGTVFTRSLGASGAGTASGIRFDLNGPFNTTFERIDGIHVCNATVTFTAARSVLFDSSATSGDLVAQIFINGISEGASGDITLTATGSTVVDNEVISVTCDAGEYMWIDITAVPGGTLEDFSVVLYE